MGSRSFLIPVLFALAFAACKHKKAVTQTAPVVNAPVEDTSNYKCRLDFKSAKTLSKKVKDNE